jgi:hypothetical protein
MNKLRAYDKDFVIDVIPNVSWTYSRVSNIKNKSIYINVDSAVPTLRHGKRFHFSDPSLYIILDL